MAKVSLRAYNREIESMIDSGHLDEAIANCRHILKIFPKHLETYRLLGKAYLEYKRYPEAVDIFMRVLAAAPSDFVAHVGMSIISDEQNRLDDAIWHMERAFETQPSNAAIQAEMQRLYGRRDGIQPPRIRMTRGALAHMYVQGELYPQAISEIKSVLKEDGGRVDMQALLARSYYRSGLKNEAAEAASVVLRTYPYCLDANRVLIEILGSDRVESAQTYRQRVLELDPYTAHVTGTVFQSNEVPDAAVSLERLDWNGQPVSLQSDWGISEAISPETGGAREPQPDWLKSVFDEPPTQPPPQPLGPAAAPAFDVSGSPTAAGEPREEIPDFLRAAGWGKSTGAFDESKSVPGYEEPEAGSPIEKGELPDWVRAMAPVEPEQPAEEEEELPDWINKIGAGVAPLPTDAGQQPDWLNQVEQPSEVQSERQASEAEPDWLRQLGQGERDAPLSSEDRPDWLKGLEAESEPAPATPSTEGPEWMDQPSQSIQPEAQAMGDVPDWMKQSDEPAQPAASASQDDLDWLKGFGSETESAPAEELDWLNQLGAQAETPSEPSSTEFQFLTPIEEQPEAAAPVPPSSEFSFREETGAETEMPVPPAPEAAAADVDKLGASEEERDDSFAWLESLAARQGASEGLLTKPEERREEEPDWAKRAKGLSPEEPATQPPANVEELGKSEQERDDSFAWLESLAARQGANEGLLTKPEERLEQEPDWVRQARDLGAVEQPPAPAPAEEQPSSIDDTAAWLRSLDEEETSPSAPEGDTTGMWLKSLDEELMRFQPSQPAREPEPEMPAPMEQIEQPQATTEEPIGMSSPEEPVEVPLEQAAVEPEAEMPAWMQNIQEVEAQTGEQVTAAEDVAEEPARMDLTGESFEVRSAPEPAGEPEVPAWMQNIEEEEAPASAPVAAAEDRAEESPEISFFEQSMEAQPPAQQAAAEPEARMPAWMQDIEEEQAAQAGAAAMPELEAERSTQPDDMPEWMQYVEDKEIAEESAPVAQPGDVAARAYEEQTIEPSEWMGAIEESAAPSSPPETAEEKPVSEPEEIPAWLSSLEEEQAQATMPSAIDQDLPAWLRAEAVEAAPEPQPEPTRAADWQPIEEKQPEPPLEPAPEPEPMPEPVSELEAEPVTPVEMTAPEMPVDPVLGRARDDLERGDIPGALNGYEKLIKKTRFLDEVIHDLRDALYRYPVDVSIWQSLGDAYMRANRLQDALDAYTKAEELLR